MLIARYTANASGVVPTFNSGYQYTIDETVSNGIYTVEINSDTDFTSCSFEDKSKLLTVEYLKVTDKVTSMNSMFSSCYRLTQLDTSNWDTSQVTNMDSIFASCSDLTQLDVSNWDTSNVTTMGHMFFYCESLTQLDVSKWKTNKITDMRDLFGGCYQLTTIGDVSNWDTSKVTSMSGMFYNCSQLTQLDVSNFDTKNVTSMSGMFYYCSQLTQLDISNFDTSTVTNMSSMFYKCSKLAQLDVSNFDTKNVTTMRSMFSNCSSLTQLDLSNFNTSNVTDMDYMFSNCSQLIQLDVSNFDTSNATRTSNMFASCSSLNEIIATNVSTSILSKLIAKIPTRTSDSYGTIKVKNTTDEITSSANAKYWNVIEGDIIEWTGLGTVVTGLRAHDVKHDNYKINIDWDTQYFDIIVTEDFNYLNGNMDINFAGLDYIMIGGHKYLTTLQVLEGIMSVTIYDPSSKNPNYNMERNYPFTIRLAKEGIYVLHGSTSHLIMERDYDLEAIAIYYNEDGLDNDPVNGYENGDYDVAFDLVVSERPYLIAKYTANIAGVVPTFNSGYVYELTETENNGIYTVEITSDSNFSLIDFKSKTGLLTVEYLKITNAVISMYKMFYGCTSLTSINSMSDWDTSNVLNMYQMFSYCESLTSLDVSSFNTTNVTDMSCMFSDCNNLTSLDVSNFDTSKVTDMTQMFNNCNNLTSLDVSNWDTANVAYMAYMFGDCNNLTILNVSNFDTSNVDDMSYMFNGCNLLTLILMNNSDYNSVNKIINVLPTRTSDSIGTLYVGEIDDINQVDMSTAQSKFWSVLSPKQYKVHLIIINNNKINKVHILNKKLKISFYK